MKGGGGVEGWRVGGNVGGRRVDGFVVLLLYLCFFFSFVFVAVYLFFFLVLFLLLISFSSFCFQRLLKKIEKFTRLGSMRSKRSGW